MRSVFTESEIEALSDALKKMALEAYIVRFPVAKIAGWYKNCRDSVQFSCRNPKEYEWHPLFFSPADDKQEPVAYYGRWNSDELLALPDERKMWRPEIDWKPVYLARSEDGL